MSKRNYRLGFLSSHGGSNMQSIIDACKNGTLDMVPAVVISNNSGSKALERAKTEGIPFAHLSTQTHPNPELLDQAIVETLQENNVDLVILAGYMKKIGPLMLNAFENRILNIHPALLPKYGGKGMYGIHPHIAVIRDGESETGATVHLVDGKYDHGRILNQIVVPVEYGDSPEILQKKVLAKEHLIYVDTLKKITAGEIIL